MWIIFNVEFKFTIKYYNVGPRMAPCVTPNFHALKIMYCVYSSTIGLPKEKNTLGRKRSKLTPFIDLLETSY